ncbi:hypothetical protein [Halorussus caseinilyticus]|uniref:DUF3006 domain-containing protein n=1 Tax=Halorussus caseinilyticus TaxID=3034025 RepID=A0ABD5WTW0_9EURY|nr:hypothetical protein [Halorussus sp. DT72]
MLETERATYEITRRQNDYFWLEVLEGGDQGIRVSVPISDETYDNDVREEVKRLDEGQIVEAVLVSEDETRPDWKFEEVRLAEDERNPSRVRANP